MPNAVVFIAVRAQNEVPDEVFRAIVGNTIRTAGFTAGSWTYDATPVVFRGTRTNVEGGVCYVEEVREGPWSGVGLEQVCGDRSMPAPAGWGSMQAGVISSFKQIVIGEPSTTALARLRDALRAATYSAAHGTGARVLYASANYMGQPLTGDRGIPRTPSASSSGAGAGTAAVLGLLGLFALGAYANWKE